LRVPKSGQLVHALGDAHDLLGENALHGELFPATDVDEPSVSMTTVSALLGFCFVAGVAGSRCSSQ
jgi:hypothetical protein